MKDIRKVSRVISAKPTLEGAGVKLKRVFGYYEVPAFDPFLLLVGPAGTGEIQQVCDVFAVVEQLVEFLSFHITLSPSPATCGRK